MSSGKGASPVLFLDIDGVLNDHERHLNGVCGLKARCVKELNSILAAYPELLIVVSSSWRYYVLNGFMTLEGFELMMQTHGVACYQRLLGVTDADAQPPIHLGERSWGDITPEEKSLVEAWGITERARQIRAYCETRGVERFIVLDDIALPIEPLVQTNKRFGLTDHDARLVKRWLGSFNFPTVTTSSTPEPQKTKSAALEQKEN